MLAEGGPTLTRMREVAREHSMVLVVPWYEEEQTGVYYNSAAVIERDGTIMGKYRKTHIPHVGPCFWEKYYFKPGNLGYPTFDTSVGRIGLIICYDRHFPEVARAVGVQGAELARALDGCQDSALMTRPKGTKTPATDPIESGTCSMISA